MPVDPRKSPMPAGTRSPWAVVGLLWFCGFFNYADRQAVTAVFPLLKDEFRLTGTELGMLGSAFMVVYALSAPLAGFVVDRASRRALIVAGLAFWSLVCAATGLARSFAELIGYRAAEGLGESFYFPASMSLLADHHGPRTRSRAMSVHQTSVYAGTAGGAVVAGYLGERFGWRSPFWVLGLLGMGYAAVLALRLGEPKREQAHGPTNEAEAEAGQDLPGGWRAPGLGSSLAEVVRTPAALLLLSAFAGANFVATAFLTWLTMFLYTKFALTLTGSSLAASTFALANLAGSLCGGLLADLAARRPGGRMRVQGFGLIVGAPFVFAAGWSSTVPAVLAALVGFGLCKGVYDANIFASMYDVVAPRVRGTAAGLMNTVGWSGGSLAPMALGFASDHLGLSLALASMSAVYVIVGALALAAAWQAPPAAAAFVSEGPGGTAPRR